MANSSSASVGASSAAEPRRAKPWTRLIQRVRDRITDNAQQRRRRRFRRALAFARLGNFLWHSAYSIAQDDRVKFRHGFRRSWYANYRRDYVSNRLRTLFQITMLISFFVYFAVLPSTLPESPGSSYFSSVMLSFIGGFSLLSYSAALISLLFNYLGRVGTISFTEFRRTLAALLIIIPVIGVIILKGESRNPFLLILFGAIGSLMIFLIGIALTTAALSIAQHVIRSRYPDGVMTIALFNALKWLEDAGEKWGELDLRSRVAGQIDASSVIARTYLFRRFHVVDHTTQLWKLQQANSIAAALSEKQRWLMTPKSDTQDALLNSLSRSLVALLSGAWDELEHIEPLDRSVLEDVPVGRLQRAWFISMGIARSISVAALPGVLFWLLKSFNVLPEIAPNTLSYIWIGILVWGALILAYMLDPQIKEKISTLKEVNALLNPMSKKQG